MANVPKAPAISNILLVED